MEARLVPTLHAEASLVARIHDKYVLLSQILVQI